MDVPYFYCNYPNRCRTSCSIRKLPDPVEVGLQQYSDRTFHIRAGRDPLETYDIISTSKAIQTTTQDVRYYAPRFPNLSKSLCSCTNENHLRMETGSTKYCYASASLLALLKYPFYPLFILDNGMNLISKSLTVLTPA